MKQNLDEKARGLTPVRNMGAAGANPAGSKFLSVTVLIKVKVIPNSKFEVLQKINPTNYKLKVKEKAIEGRANIAVINALSSYFNVKKADIRIIKGAASKDKIIEIASL
jgi:hypothetical protein